MPDDSPADQASTHWFTSDVKQMGPVIVAFFILLAVVVGPQRNSPAEHATIQRGNERIERKLDLITHFEWAKCQNDASIIADPLLRAAAVARCIPPVDKRDEVGDEQSYLFDAPAMPKPTVVVRRSSLSEQMSSGSSSSIQYTRRLAEANAERQRAIHLAAISGSTVNHSPYQAP